MKTLLLMRHAKSAWDVPGQDDYDRALNARGRASADAVAAWLMAEGLVPDHALVSAAARTTETWDRLCNVFGSEPPATRRRALYLSGPQVMLDHVNDLPETADTAILIAHQPGMAAMTHGLSDGSEDGNAARAYGHFPTAAVAIMYPTSALWADVHFGSCRFARFVTPRALMSA